MSDIKGLTLWNPYAFAMVARTDPTADPLKTIETRSWSTSYRGPLAIHAAVRDTNDLRAAWLAAMNRPRDNAAFRACGIDGWDVLPFGMVIGICNLVAVKPTRLARIDTAKEVTQLLGNDQWESEQQWGNFAPDRFLWYVEEMERLPVPLPYRGAQQLFDVKGLAL